MIFVVLTVLFLHISVMRIVLRFEIIFDSDERYILITVKLFFITVVKFSPDYKKAVEKFSGNKKEDDGKNKKKSKFITYITSVAFAVLKRIEVRYLGVFSDLGTGDAASTALIYGGISSAFESVCSVLGCEKYTEITPDYNNMRFFVDFGGIISLCLADIIYAAVSALFGEKNTKVEKQITASVV